MRHAVILALLAGSVVTSAQSPASEKTAFEVASVKQNTSGSSNSMLSMRPGGAFQAINSTLNGLIAYAYGVRRTQLAGGPEWVESDKFDVLARASEDVSGDQLRQMVRALLADRFRLIVHTETREQPIYALVHAGNDRRLGASVKASTRDCSGGSSPCGVNMTTDGRGGALRATAVPLTEFAVTLSGLVDRIVVDRTGLTGAFDIELRFTRDNLQPADPSARGIAGDAPSIFAALPEQLGLKLESQRGRVEFVIIDTVDRPTPD